jgi:shikimate dehydrogenase
MRFNLIRKWSLFLNTLVEAARKMSLLKHTYGLIGYPLGHSFSQQFFTEKFRALGLHDHEYLNFPIEEISQLPDLIKDIPRLRGFNVTIPHKQRIMPLLDRIDDQAAAIGAVNCVSLLDGKLTGYNTDADGFKLSIKPFLENHYERALILGTGGSSRAVAYVLKQWGIPFHFVSREKRNGAISYADINPDSIQHFKLIINTTPLGMFPNVDASPPLPYEALGSSHFLYDLVYNPEETKFLQLGKLAGARTMNGMAMLRLQAEKSWEIWKQVG